MDPLVVFAKGSAVVKSRIAHVASMLANSRVTHRVVVEDALAFCRVCAPRVGTRKARRRMNHSMFRSFITRHKNCHAPLVLAWKRYPSSVAAVAMRTKV